MRQKLAAIGDTEYVTSAHLIFRGDDAAYMTWLDANPDGYVVNTPRVPKANNVKLHHASCPHIRELQPGYLTWTAGEYIKVCASEREALEAWGETTVGSRLQDGCACIQYPATGRRKPKTNIQARPSPSPANAGQRRVETGNPVTANSPISDGLGLVEASKRPGYDNKDPASLRTKHAVREILARLSASPGEVLHAVMEGPLSLGVDLDNGLLYDMGGRQSAACRNGVLLERRPDTACNGVRYHYGLTEDPGFGVHEQGRLLARFAYVPLRRAPTGWSEVWRALKASDGVDVVGHASTGDLVVALTLHGTARLGACDGQMTKHLVDGVMVALHAHATPATIEEVAPILASRLGEVPARVATWLGESDGAVLGAEAGLVKRWGATIQCHPDDRRIAALRIEIDRTAGATSLSGTVACAVTPDLTAG